MTGSVLLTTDHSQWGLEAARLLVRMGFAVAHVPWEHGETRRARLSEGWAGDWIVGFKADHIFSSEERAQARRGAINFHPAPPHFRGIGSYEAAAAGGWSRYGVTCHHMATRIDAGPIIRAKMFNLGPGLDPAEIRELAGAQLFALLADVATELADGGSLPSSSVTWSGPLHKRADLPVARG